MTTSRAVLEKEGVRFGRPRLPSRESTRRGMTHIHLAPSAEPPVGVSEPGTDAIFAATGRRSRERTVEKTSSTRRRR